LVKVKLSATDSNTLAALLQAKAQDAAPKAKSKPELQPKYFSLKPPPKIILCALAHGTSWTKVE